MSPTFRWKSFFRATMASWPLAYTLLLITAGCLAWQLLQPSPLLSPQARARPVTPRGHLASGELSTIDLFEAVSPSVVNIWVARAEDIFRNEWEMDGSGSGFVWSDQGYIVTNYHVIAGAEPPLVTLSDQTTWEGRLVGFDEASDIAVLKINADAHRLRPIVVGTSDDLRVGQQVFAIGNPFGLDLSLTTGIISGLGREIQSTFNDQRICGLIQTDAAINPGNSGGPLLDSAGRLIGVNTAIVSPSGTNVGLGFAVAVDQVNRVVPQILRTGRATQPGLGISLWDEHTNRELLRNYGGQGVYVRSVLAGGVAEAVGLTPATFPLPPGDQMRHVLGDLIVAVNGQPLSGVHAFQDLLESMDAGDNVRLEVDRHREGETTRISLWVALDCPTPPCS